MKKCVSAKSSPQCPDHMSDDGTFDMRREKNSSAAARKTALIGRSTKASASSRAKSIARLKSSSNSGPRMKPKSMGVARKAEDQHDRNLEDLVIGRI